MATCTVSGLIKDVSETAISGAIIRARIVTPYFSTTVQIMPKEIFTTSDVTGAWSLVLNQGANCIITIEYPPNSLDTNRALTFSIIVPTATTANFSTLAIEV